MPRITAWNPESAPHSSSAPTTIGPRAIYIRPSCSIFLSALSSFANIIVWSSMCKLTIQKICKYLFKELSMPLHIVGQDSCDRINVIGWNNKVTTMKIKDMHKDIFLKTLSKGLFYKFNGKFTKDNTIIINNSPVKHILNDFKNVLLPISWSHDKWCYESLEVRNLFHKMRYDRDFVNVHEQFHQEGNCCIVTLSKLHSPTTK